MRREMIDDNLLRDHVQSINWTKWGKVTTILGFQDGCHGINKKLQELGNLGIEYRYSNCVVGHLSQREILE